MSEIPMPILAFDLSTPRGVVALATPRGSQHLYNLEISQHLSWLMPAAHRLLTEAELVPGDLAAIAVGRGPGSFTGIRTAVMTAKTMAHLLRVPLAAPNALETYAAAVKEEARPVCACIDARRGEVYYGLYLIQGGLPRLRGEMKVAPPAEMAREIQALSREQEQPVNLLGTGVDAYRDLLVGELAGAARILNAPYPAGPDLLEMARVALAVHTEDPLELAPFYLRLPDAWTGPLGCAGGGDAGG
jgi:tRNA threonylcarbamoyladenosine biosynthesis protein TsaB